MSTGMTPGAALRLNLIMPRTSLNLGFANIDPLAIFLGGALETHLQAYMCGPRSQRVRQDGQAEDVYPLALPDGQAFFVTLAGWEIGVGNANGCLQIIAPVFAESWIYEQLRASLIAMPDRMLSSDQRQVLSRFHVRLLPGARASLRIDRLGEVGIEAG